MIFVDRAEAGRLLARELLERRPTLRDMKPIVLAIPRGGVAVGRAVARELGAPLDIFLARKLGAPGQEELGIGAVAPGGIRVLDEELVAALRVPPEYIEQVTERERAELERRLERYREGRAAPEIAGRAVILVDDGLATGVTARAALAALRVEHPAALLFAAPVCSLEGAAALRAEGHDVVCVAAPPDFRGVGEWYQEFEQLTDEDVVTLLRDAAS